MQGSHCRAPRVGNHTITGQLYCRLLQSFNFGLRSAPGSFALNSGGGLPLARRLSDPPFPLFAEQTQENVQ